MAHAEKEHSSGVEVHDGGQPVPEDGGQTRPRQTFRRSWKSGRPQLTETANDGNERWRHEGRGEQTTEYAGPEAVQLKRVRSGAYNYGQDESGKFSLKISRRTVEIVHAV